MIVSDVLIFQRKDLVSGSRGKNMGEINTTDFKDDRVFTYSLILFIDDDGKTIILKNRYGSSRSRYTTTEVKELISPLVDQIEYYQKQYIKCRRFISRTPWYKLIFRKWGFIDQILRDDDQSNTMIENMIKGLDSNDFENLKKFISNKNEMSDLC